MHCLIAYAASTHLPPQALQGLSLPRLQALLGRLHAAPPQRDPDDALLPSLPHERALAHALGWTPQAPMPWAAWQSAQTPGGLADARAQAWITPCHWQVGMDQVFMRDPAELQLSEHESQALLHSLQPYLQDDGLSVRWHDALHWHACGELLEGWHAPSLDRVIGANVRPWLTRGLPPALVRLHSEMQMLAYQHPVNDARLARGQPPVNAFWVHGAGRLPAGTPTPAQIQVMDDLRAPALAGDVHAWRQAWQALDARLPAPDTPELRLTLCSESTAQHWSAAPNGWLMRLRRAFSPPDTGAALRALITP